MGRGDRWGNRKSREQYRKRGVPELGYYYIVTDTDQTEKNYLEGLRAVSYTHLLAFLCVLGVVTFCRNIHNNYWWRWIYLFGGIYVLFDLYAIAVGLEFWNKFLLWMYDVNSPYWNLIWFSFVLLGGFVFVLGIKLLIQRKK